MMTTLLNLRLLAVTAAMSALTLVVGGCDALGQELLTYDEEVSEEITVPGVDILGTNPLAPEQVFPADFGALLSSQLEQSFSTEGADPDSVQSLKLIAMKVVVQDPEENGRKVRHLGFISSLSFDMSSGDVGPVRVAESAPGAFDDDPVEYTFEVSEEELKEMLAAGEMTMTTNLETDNQPTFATTLVFSATVRVVADPIGALF
jgi:hypothetical protein